MEIYSLRQAPSNQSGLKNVTSSVQQLEQSINTLEKTDASIKSNNTLKRLIKVCQELSEAIGRVETLIPNRHSTEVVLDALEVLSSQMRRIDNTLNAVCTEIKDLAKNSEERAVWINFMHSTTFQKRPEPKDSEPRPQLLLDGEIEKSTTDKSKGQMNQYDAALVNKLTCLVQKRHTEFDFSVGDMAEAMAMSRQHLTRKTKQLIGLNAVQYLQEVRLSEAKRLLKHKVCTSVKAVAFEVGIQDTAYFSKLFKRRFGISPSEYLVNKDYLSFLVTYK